MTRKIPAEPPSESVRPVPQKPFIEISEEEQWRIIRKSGILEAARAQDRQKSLLEERISLGDEIFNAVLLIIPFSALLLLMEM